MTFFFFFLANFFLGDLTIFYPAFKSEAPLSSQLFKGTIIALDTSSITVRLRAKQFNDSLFRNYEFWNMEHDSLDSGFNVLFRSLFQFCNYQLPERKKFLSLKPPAPSKPKEWPHHQQLTDEQNRIMGKIISAEDYFLLWGPPGTGKTSVIVKYLLQYLINQTDEQILLLAYTNRAVDEVCHALIAAGLPDFLRIGSKYSTDLRYRNNLLNTLTADITSRIDLQRAILKYRVVVGTISSVLGKPELFELKKFDRLIIDEATQVLEPMVAGLLPGFQKVLLIGDHHQLAAVVTQGQQERLVNDESLISIGVSDLGNSYFERIFSRCEEEGWSWAYDKLSYQGRMHEDVMQFPSDQFYGGMLKILPGNQNIQQSAPLHFEKIPDDLLSTYLSTRRVLFFPVRSKELFNSKINVAESKFVAEVIEKLIQLYEVNNKTLSLSDVGVITPFRAQIAQIKTELESRNIFLDQLLIDTVERFQGGAKNIIIISLCVNSENQLDNLINLSSDHIDRKLNVALTRAKDQVIMIGDPQALAKNPVYSAFMDRFTCAYQAFIDQ
ncbi:MAG: AAA family ATPase [Saprospiraceae bacterium]|nr:AAA family ATPase [Saprospiraceae bacterium]